MGCSVTRWTLQGPVGCFIGRRYVPELGHILQKYNKCPTSFGSIYHRSPRIYKGQWGVPVTSWTLQGPVECSIGRRYVPDLGRILQKYITCPTSFESIYCRVTENIQRQVGYSSDQLDITGTSWMFHRPEVCSQTWTHAPEIKYRPYRLW